MDNSKKSINDNIAENIEPSATKKEKKLSLTKLDKLIKSAVQGNVVDYLKDGEPTGIVLKKTISPVEFVQLVSDVVGDVFGFDNDGCITYFSSLKPISIASRFLQYYTNLKEGIGNDRVFALLYQTGLISDMQSNVSSQWEDALKAIDDGIEYKKREMLSGERERLNSISSKLESATNSLNAMTEFFSNSVGDEKMKRVFDNLATINEDELTRNVINLMPDKDNQK